MAKIGETQSVHVTPAGITREGASNTKGHFRFREHISKNGQYHVESDLKTQDFSPTDKETATKGNSLQDVGGSKSAIVSGVNEKISGSTITITGSSNMYLRGYQELADQKQVKMVAARSQNETAPDTSAMGQVKTMLTPAPGLLQNTVQPKSEDAKKQAASNSPLGQLTSVFADVATQIKQMVELISICVKGSLKEVLKIQKNYLQENAKNAVKEKAKMVQKMDSTSKKAFRQSEAGKKLFPAKGTITMDQLDPPSDDGQIIKLNANPNDPLKGKVVDLPEVDLNFPLLQNPSVEFTPQVQQFDPKEYQKIAAETNEEVIDLEKNIT